MKTLFKLGLVAGLLLCASAEAQTYRKYVVTSNVVTVAASGVSNIVNSMPTVRVPYNSVSFALTFAGSDAGANGSNVGFGFTQSIDGTNFMTNDLLWIVRRPNGVLRVTAATNFAQGAAIGPAQYLKLYSITNGNNTAFTFSNGWVAGFYIP